MKSFTLKGHEECTNRTVKERNNQRLGIRKLRRQRQLEEKKGGEVVAHCSLSLYEKWWPIFSMLSRRLFTVCYIHSIDIDGNT